jgi:Fe-S cluster assembly protein SufD
MASNSSEKDHGNYVPTPVGAGVGVRDGESLKEVFVVGEDRIPECFVAGKDSSLDITVIVLPGCKAGIPLKFELTGEGASVRLSGIFLCKDDDGVSFDITMHHRAPRCKSNQVFNGIAAGRSQCSFSGRIIVAPGASLTEAYQENHNILLGDLARVGTKPRLEIYNDDVKCSHGATVGKLSEEEQFYMRSRGIPEEEAKVLQMISFVAPVLSGCDSPDLAARVESAIRSLL